MALPTFYPIQEGLLFHLLKPHSTLPGYREHASGGWRAAWEGFTSEPESPWRQCWEPARREPEAAGRKAGTLGDPLGMWGNWPFRASRAGVTRTHLGGAVRSFPGLSPGLRKRERGLKNLLWASEAWLCSKTDPQGKPQMKTATPWP